MHGGRPRRTSASSQASLIGISVPRQRELRNLGGTDSKKIDCGWRALPQNAGSSRSYFLSRVGVVIEGLIRNLDSASPRF
jgi:hypothetical protein